MHRLSLRELGAVLGFSIERSDDEQLGFERFYDQSLALLSRQFVSPQAFKDFVHRKFDQAREREAVRRIAAIFHHP